MKLCHAAALALVAGWLLLMPPPLRAQPADRQFWPRPFTPEQQAEYMADASATPSLQELNAMPHEPGKMADGIGLSLDPDGYLRWHVGIFDHTCGGANASAAWQSAIMHRLGNKHEVIIEPNDLIQVSGGGICHPALNPNPGLAPGFKPAAR